MLGELFVLMQARGLLVLLQGGEAVVYVFSRMYPVLLLMSIELDHLGSTEQALFIFVCLSFSQGKRVKIGRYTLHIRSDCGLLEQDFVQCKVSCLYN